MTKPTLDPRLLGVWRLVTSNENKRAEFARLGLDLPSVSIDLPEVDGTPLEVIVRKSLAAGDYTVCEDTSLAVEGADVGVNVRWLMDRVGDFAGRAATWRVMLASNNGRTISVYEGVVEGMIVSPTVRAGFGFDPIFAPDGFGGASLADLEAAGRKDEVSARRLAAEALHAAVSPLHHVRCVEVPDWTGGWQGAKP